MKDKADWERLSMTIPMTRRHLWRKRKTRNKARWRVMKSRAKFQSVLNYILHWCYVNMKRLFNLRKYFCFYKWTCKTTNRLTGCKRKSSQSTVFIKMLSWWYCNLDRKIIVYSAGWVNILFWWFRSKRSKLKRHQSLSVLHGRLGRRKMNDENHASDYKTANQCDVHS